MSAAEWVPSQSADAGHDDQEIDLGDGWWAEVVDPGPVGRTVGVPWKWYVHDRWLADEHTGRYSTAAGGDAPTQAGAKAAALDAYRTGHGQPPTEATP